MSVPLAAFLLLWGLTLSPVTEAATFFDTRPSLWAESQSPLNPWANVTLRCQAQLETLDFQLLKNGVAQELVHLEAPAMEHQFLLGAVTSNNRGLYRCRSKLGGSNWAPMSNLLAVTGTEPLPPPSVSVEPVAWITPGLNTILLCQAGLRRVTYLLRREGDKEFLEVAEAGRDGKATFPIHRAGNYTCSYRTHAAGDPSALSATVIIEEMAMPPPPLLSFGDKYPKVLRPGAHPTLVCVAPLSGVDFQLRWRDELLLVPRSSTSPDRTFFHLDSAAPGHGGPYTCRYRLHREGAAWSADSEPMELVWNDETLPAPGLEAEPADLRPAPGSLVQLSCQAPRAGLRFALQREDAGSRRLHSLLTPAGPKAVFELRDVSAADSANYSCVYLDPASPFAGSAPSASLELRVDGSLPPPRIQALWQGLVTAGHDAVLRCEGRVPGVTFELLLVGEEVALEMQSTTRATADLVLPFVGPQHSGNYTCRYRSWWPSTFVSEHSDPVELLVDGS